MALNDNMSTAADSLMSAVGDNKEDDFLKLIAALGVAKQADSVQDNNENIRNTSGTQDSNGAETSKQIVTIMDKQTPEELKKTKASNVEDTGAKVLAKDYCQ
eukprot:11798511-Ditylum_brightwellii.AAC.1